MNIFNYKRVDSLNCYVEKKALPGFIEHIKECQNNYTYPQDYRDTGFVIQIPVYLKNRYYTFGDENFSISFYDTTDEDQHTVRSISIYYDFDSSYREFVLKELAAGKRQETVDPITGRKMHSFFNYDSRYAADVFLENNIIVSYYTRDKQFESELRRSVLSFKLKAP